MDLTLDLGHSHKDTPSLQGLLVGSGHLHHSHFPLVVLVSTGGSLMLYLVSFWILLQSHNQRLALPLPWNPHRIVTVPKMSRPFPPWHKGHSALLHSGSVQRQHTVAPGSSVQRQHTLASGLQGIVCPTQVPLIFNLSWRFNWKFSGHKVKL